MPPQIKLNDWILWHKAIIGRYIPKDKLVLLKDPDVWILILKFFKENYEKSKFIFLNLYSSID
jgi:hypothetical protein